MEQYDRSLCETAWKEQGFSKAEIDNMDRFYDRVKFSSLYFKDGVKPWVPYEYQKESLNWYGLRKNHRSGRSTGKTKDLEICSVQTAIVQPNQETLIAAQREQHIEPVMERLIKIFETTDLRNLLKKKPQRSPDYMIQLKNEHIIWGRIGGPNGQNFQGMHVANQHIEEAQEMTRKSWLELLPGLNDGGRRWTYGVPNGVRNMYYEFTHDRMMKLFSWNRENCPGTTPEDIKEWEKLYGKGSADYLHLVRGIDGGRRFSTFDIDDYLACRTEAPFMEVFLTKEDLKTQSIHQLLSHIWTAKAMYDGMYFCGVDVGWTTDPTEIELYCYDGKYLHNFLRVHIDQWQLPDQYEAIKYIDSRFPFTAIGVDRAGGGIGLLQDLQRIDERWNYMTFGFHFGENIITGVSEATGEFITRECKTYGIQLIEQKMKERTISFPKNCLDRENEYVNLTHEVRKQTGQIVYSNYSDHIISADIVAMLAIDQYLMKNGFETPDLGVILEPLYFGSERIPAFAGQ